MDTVPDQGRIHVDNVSRRRSDAPSINAIYERSRASVPNDVTGHDIHRLSIPIQNGGSRRPSQASEGRRLSVSHSNQVLPVTEEPRMLPDPRMETRISHDRESHDHRDPRDLRVRRDQRDREFYNPNRPIRSGTTDRSRGSRVDDYEEAGDDRYVVPALPMPIAIICCIFNFLVPGFGSLLAAFCVLCCARTEGSMFAAFCVLCCARTEGMTCREKCGSCCTVFGIGLLQLLLAACFLIGWLWSCIWGITFIGMSAAYYDEEDYDEYGEYPTRPVRRHHQPTGNTPLPTPEVVVDQPYPGVHYADRAAARSRDRRQRSRRTISRISLTPSNFIYPMRAQSSIVYNSPPPPYRERATPPPPYWNTHQQGARREESRDRQRMGSRDADSTSAGRTLRPPQITSETIYEENGRT